MSYLFGYDDSTSFSGPGCGASCGCGPCQNANRKLGEWYVKADDDDTKPAPAPVATKPQPSNVSGWPLAESSLGYGGYFSEAPARAPQRVQLPHPQVTAQLPASGAGYYTYYATDRRGRLDSPPGYHRYARPEVVRAIEWIGSEWQRMHPRGPRLGIGDLSLLGGGPTPRHGAHQRGLEVDIRPPRSDGRELSAAFPDPPYSRDLTQQLVAVIRRNPIARVRVILFNDTSITGVRSYPGHNNHLHVGFLPAVVRSRP